MKEQKEVSQHRFDETYVDCNNCTHYWDNSCDGVSERQKRPCTAYLATRHTDIPKRLKAVEKRILTLSMSNLFFGLALIYLLVERLL